MAARQPEDLVFQFMRVGQVAIVRQSDTKRAIDVKWLCFCGAGRARGRIANMTNTYFTGQALHMAGFKNIFNQAIRLA